MKTVRWLLSVLAVVMFVMAGPVFATSTHTIRCKNVTGDTQYGQRLIFNALYVVLSARSSKFNKFTSSFANISGVYRTVLYYQFQAPDPGDPSGRVDRDERVDISFVTTTDARTSDLRWIDLHGALTATSGCALVR